MPTLLLAAVIANTVQPTELTGWSGSWSLGGALVAGSVLCVILGLLVTILMVLLRRPTHTSASSEEVRRVITAAESRARDIVAEAEAEARRARLTLEEDRVRALSEEGESIERFLDAYRTNLDAAIKELAYGIEKEHARVTSHFVESLQRIEGRVSQNAEEARQSMDSFTKQSSALFDRLSYEIENVEKGIQHLALALEEAAANESGKNAELVRAEMRKIGEQTAQAVLKVAEGLNASLRVNLEKEFASITAELVAYRDARVRLINERLLSLIEETAQIALQKELPMQAQADLVYRALEEAKERGFFV